MSEEVTLEVVNLATGISVITKPISLCTTHQYALNPGQYALKTTYKGQVQERNTTVREGEVTKEEFFFKEVRPTGKVAFEGVVSAQEKEGENVTVTVTKPDETTESVVAITKADLTYSVTYENVSGDYKAVARIEADAFYDPAQSTEVAFSIGKLPRTITLTVKPA